VAIGIGCRAGCGAAAIESIVREALAAADLALSETMGLFTIVDKQSEPGIAAAAAALFLPLVYLSRADLQRAAPEAMTKSARVMALFGVPSIAETAALAGAGRGARLVLPRMSRDGATCAIARADCPESIA
jgi:cobalt-precorrin 5A hydrolase